MHSFDLSLIFLISGYIAFLSVARLQNHTHMLIANALCCFLIAVYLLMNDSLAGAATSSIACIASLTQIALSKSKSKQSANTRNVIAVIFAVVAVMILYQKPNDLLPCIAFTQKRIFEAQNSPHYIRLAMCIGTLLWAIYAFTQGLYLMAGLEMTVSAYAALCLIKYSAADLFRNKAITTAAKA